MDGCGGGGGDGDRSWFDGGSACLFEDVEEDANESCFCWFNAEIMRWSAEDGAIGVFSPLENKKYN